MIQGTKCICLLAFTVCQRRWNPRHIMYGRMKMFCKKSLHLCWFCFYKRFLKKGDSRNFAKYILLGHKGCHRSQTLLSGQPLKSQNYFTSWHFCKKEPRLDISRLHLSWIWNFAEILSSNLFLYHCLTQCKIWERPCNCSVLLELARFRRSVETDFSSAFSLIDFCQFQQNFQFAA